MLSYRSPDGLHEKFGREWFRKPGATLGEPGLFNQESWLRQHGHRIARRFDPWTWRVFARTMDLHDVAEGREGTDAALDRVARPVLVLGFDPTASTRPRMCGRGRIAWPPAAATPDTWRSIPTTGTTRF